MGKGQHGGWGSEGGLSSAPFCWAPFSLSLCLTIILALIRPGFHLGPSQHICTHKVGSLYGAFSLHLLFHRVAPTGVWGELPSDDHYLGWFTKSLSLGSFWSPDRSYPCRSICWYNICEIWRKRFSFSLDQPVFRCTWEVVFWKAAAN